MNSKIGFNIFSNNMISVSKIGFYLKYLGKFLSLNSGLSLKKKHFFQLPLKRDRKRHNKPAELDDSAYESNSIGSASTSGIPQPPPSRRRKPKATEPPRRKRAHEPQQRVPRKRLNMDNHVEF